MYFIVSFLIEAGRLGENLLLYSEVPHSGRWVSSGRRCQVLDEQTSRSHSVRGSHILLLYFAFTRCCSHYNFNYEIYVPFGNPDFTLEDVHTRSHQVRGGILAELFGVLRFFR